MKKESLSMEEYKKDGKYHPSSILRRFGTWRKALDKFIEYINKEEIPVVAEVGKNENEMSIITAGSIYKHKTKRNISSGLGFKILQRDNFKCKICGRSPATDPKIELHVDCIVAYSKGGETVPENLQTLCSTCNIGKSNL